MPNKLAHAHRVLMMLLAAGLLAASAVAQSQEAPAPKPRGTPFRNQPARLAKRAVMYYESLWGVDALSVKSAESGEIIRFSYHIMDAEKAKTLNDKNLNPVLIDPQAGVQLVVPAVEQVGFLRQSSTPEAGKSYWMAFSNSGERVKRGDRVAVIIGQFRAEGLIVE